MKNFRQIAKEQNTTVIMVTHNNRHARLYSDHFVLIEDGQIMRTFLGTMDADSSGELNNFLDMRK